MAAGMRLAAILAAVVLGCSCAPAPAPVEPPKDPTADASYGKTVDQLAALTKQAEALVTAGHPDEASPIVQHAQSLQARLLSAPRPTLPAMEAASDLDDLYGRMLMANKQYGWARDFFQKNAVRWKAWKPQTPETEKRKSDALKLVGECEKKMTE
jgi:ABC-type branched-subunit amino acid transport system substrate-binding protein